MGAETAILGAGLAQGILGSQSAENAANTGAAAADRATQAQREALAQQRADLQPWVNTGAQANNRLSAMLGLNGQQSNFTSDDPSYQWRLGQGQQAVDNSASSRGQLLSGATLKALTNYGQGAASQEFQNSYNRLNGLSGQGQSAAAGQGAAAMNFGNQSGENIMQGANAAMAGQVGSSNAWSNAINGGINGYQQNQLMGLIGKRGGGGGYQMSEPYAGYNKDIGLA